MRPGDADPGGARPDPPSTSAQIPLIYPPGHRPPPRELALYTLQWVLITFYGAVWGFALVGIALGLRGDALAGYMGRVVLMIGLATLVQVAFGHRLAMLSGPNVIPSFAILAAVEAGGVAYALQSFTALAIAGIIVGITALLGGIQYLQRVWTPLVLGAMVMMVGLAVARTGLELIVALGFGWPFWVGIGLALLAGFLSLRAPRLLASTAIGIIIIVGYLIFIVTGQFDWRLVRSMPALTVPELFPFGLGIPPLGLVVTMTLVTILAALNLYGNETAFARLVGDRLGEGRIRRSFALFGFVENALAGVLGVPGYVAYGENLGIVSLTRVASRLPLLIAAAIVIGLSFLGVVAGLMAAMPEPLAGAILLGVAANVIGIGANAWARAPSFGLREQFIVSFAIFLSLGLFLLPPALVTTLPRLIVTLVTNPVAFVILVVIVLEQVVFRSPRSARPPGDVPNVDGR